MLACPCIRTSLVTMRIGARLLQHFASSSATRGVRRRSKKGSSGTIGSSSGGSGATGSSRRPLSNVARTAGSSRMAGEHQPSFPARESSHDSATRPLATGAAAVAGGGSVQRQDGERFRVSESIELVLHRGTITRWFVDGETDAIVNAANPRMLGGGGVDGAIHRSAGPELRQACMKVPEVSPAVRCPVGEARITPAFDLPVSKVIHTVGPIYYEHDSPAGLLSNAYRNSLKTAIANGIKYICFPAISCGLYSYPIAEAATISLSVIKEASNGLSEVHFVMFEKETYVGWMEEASKQLTKI